MKQIRYLFGGLLFLFASIGSVTAQEVSDYSKLQPSDYSSITLPPLDLLFENAKSAPTYELATVKEQIERKLLAKEKRAFLGFFSLRGSYQYGMFGNESTYTDVAIAPYLTYATQAQNGYTVGAGVNIPLDGLFDLTARVKRQKLNVRTAQLEREVKFEEMKKEIILLYTTATSQLNILKLNAEALMLANVQYSIAEKDFSNGAIDSGSDNNFYRLEIDYRQYKTLGKRKVLAWTVQTKNVFGNVPLTKYALSGTPFDLRGYYMGQFRDKSSHVMMAEYRQMINTDKSNWVKKMLNHVGYVAWGGCGFMGPTPGKIEGVLPNLGLGLRIEVQPRMNVRLDFGRDMVNKQNLFYFNMTEAF